MRNIKRERQISDMVKACVKRNMNVLFISLDNTSEITKLKLALESGIDTEKVSIISSDGLQKIQDVIITGVRKEKTYYTVIDSIGVE